MIDRRTGSEHLLPLLPAGLAALCTLPYGDACWYGLGPGGAQVGVGVELKRVNDLLGCLHDGRFVGHQLPGMLLAYQYTYLMVEGITRPGADGNLEVFKPYRNDKGGEWYTVRIGTRTCEYDKWEAHLETLRRKTPLRVIHSTGPAHTARELVSLYKWWAHGGGWDSHQSHTGVHIPPDPHVRLLTQPLYRRTVLKVAQQLPGVREVIADRVQARFMTVREMVEAGAKDWESVDGIGAGKALQIMGAIHGPLGDLGGVKLRVKANEVGTLGNLPGKPTRGRLVK